MTIETAGGLTVEQAAANLLAIEDSYPEPTDDAAEADPIESEEVEPEEIEESEESESDTDEGEDESDTTLEEESQEPDDRIAKREKELTADYTRKTQALADERKTFEAERSEVRAMREQYAALLPQIEEALNATKPAEPDWEKLRDSDPAAFAVQWAEWQRFQQREAAVKAEREKVQKQLADEQGAAFTAYLEDQKEKLLQAIPDWQDAEKAKTEKTALYEAGSREYGFTDEDFANVVDHRLVLMLRDALKYRELAKKGKETVESKKVIQKVLQPGSPASKPKGREAEAIKLRQELKRTGDPRIAAKLFELMEG